MLKRILKLSIGFKYYYSVQTNSVVSFRKLVQTPLYVDKSNIIKDLIDDNLKYVIITRPQGWGKTINMEMIRTFFELQDQPAPGQTSNKELFLKLNINNCIDTREIFKRILIRPNIKEELSGYQFEILWSLDFQNKQHLLRNHREDSEAVKALKNILQLYQSNLKAKLDCISGLDIKVKDYLSLEDEKDRLFRLNKRDLEHEKIIQLIRKKEEILQMMRDKLSEPNEQLKEIKEEFNYVNRFQGSFPVIFLTLGSVTEGIHEEIKVGDKRLLQNIRYAISKAFKEHDYIYKDYLIDTLDIYDEQKSFLNQQSIAQLEDLLIKKNILLHHHYQEFKSYLVGDLSVDITDAIDILIKHVCEHHKQKVIVIVDEYDAPRNSILGLDTQEYVERIWKNMFGTLKDNGRLKLAIMTGILRIPKSGDFSGLNCFYEYGVQDKKYAKYFAFTDPEVENLLKISFPHKSIEDQSIIKEKVREWYNGYTIGDSTLYNTGCIMSYLMSQNSEIGGHWQETWFKQFLEKTLRNPDITLSVLDLIKTGFYDYRIDSSIDFAKITEYDYFALLLNAGYLTQTQATETKYKIPNLEVKQYFQQKLLPLWLSNICSIPSGEIIQILNDLTINIENISQYREIVEKRLLTSFSTGRESDSDFQILLRGFSSYVNEVQGKHSLSTVTTAKYNKYIDSIYFPKIRQSDTALIHFYRTIETGEDLNEVLDDALWQVYLNQYISKVLDLTKKSNDHCGYIFVRILVFHKENSKWCLTTEEFQHTLEQANKINEIFSTNGKLLKNYEQLQDGKDKSGSYSEIKKKEFRQIFLKQYDALKLNKFLLRFSQKPNRGNQDHNVRESQSESDATQKK